MRAYERLMKYIQFDTASNEASETCPSSPGQLALGAALVEEMRALGMADAMIDESGYVYASIPATDPSLPAIGLIAHLDTVRGVPCTPMRASIVDFDGTDTLMSMETGEMLLMNQYPFLPKYAGQKLIMSDGRTLLGADDKAGIAEILTACERILREPGLRHGRIAVAFTPDEEIGRGADKFDLTRFDAEFAYTVDGGELGEIEYESFNAATAVIDVQGIDIHPGTAKDKMKNALTLAMQFVQQLPPWEVPEHTAGYEGFYHVIDFSGCVEKARVKLIVRDHDRARFNMRKARLERIAEYMNDVHGAGTFTVTLTDSYYNMREVLDGRQEIVARAVAAMESAGVTPLIGPIRGGTDGSRLSFMGLPCPNLSTGGMNFHGRHECIPVESMDKMVEVLVTLVTEPENR